MLPQQYPVHVIPAMAGSSELHRLVVGGSLGLNNGQYRGGNINVSYDQLVSIVRCGVGLYYSGNDNYWNPIANNIRDSISDTFFKEQFYIQERQSTYGGVISPKLNLSSYGKILYTLSPALVFEHSDMKANRIDQLEQFKYNQLSTSPSGEASRTYNRFIRQRPAVKSNSIGLSLLFNSPTWYVSGGVAIRQLLIRENGNINQIESNSSEIMQKDYSLENINTNYVTQFAAGITLPKRTSLFSVVLSGNVSAQLTNTQFYSGDSSEFFSYTETHSIPGFYQGNISGVMRYENFLVGLSSTAFYKQYNAAISAGMQNKKYRVMAAYNPGVGTMKGCAEIVGQVKF